MESPSLILTSYQNALGRAMDVVANNVANVNTTGFKREDTLFETMVIRPTMNEKYDFAVDKATFRDTSPGPLITTGNPFDIALQGDGYLSVQTKSGTKFMRAGAFQLNGDGEIVTGLGDKLLGESDQAIVIPSEVESVNISSDGIVTGKTDSDTTVIQLGKVKVVKFDKEQELQNAGNGQYTTTQTARVQPASEVHVVQGMLERSNVDSVSEMTKMITVLRSYQQTAKLAEQEADRMRNAITKLSRSTM